MRTLAPTWGQSLLLTVHDADVGLKNIALAMRVVAPRSAVSGTTLATLYKVANIHEMDDDDRYRAWIVLTALREDLDEWGIDASALDPNVDAEKLRRHLLEALYAPRDLNPEPAGYGTVTPLRPRNRRDQRGPRSRAA